MGRKFDEKYEAIKQAGREELSSENIVLLKKALRDKNSVLVRAAAKVVREKSFKECVGELQEAFLHFLKVPQDDTNCLAKAEIIDTLYLLDYPCFEIYLAASKYIQKEAVYIGTTVQMEDCADNMRARALQALVSFAYAGLFFVIVKFLNDECVIPRKAAVDALGILPSTESELLLRMKVHAGDKENEVLGLCFSALIAISPERSIKFVAKYLDDVDNDIAFLAALALGESCTMKAYDILTNKFTQSHTLQLKQQLILPISLLRIEKARQFLTDIADSGPPELRDDAKRAINEYFAS